MKMCVKIAKKISFLNNVDEGYNLNIIALIENHEMNYTMYGLIVLTFV